MLGQGQSLWQESMLARENQRLNILGGGGGGGGNASPPVPTPLHNIIVATCSHQHFEIELLHGRIFILWVVNLTLQFIEFN